MAFSITLVGFFLIQIAHGQLHEVTVTTDAGTFIGYQEDVQLHYQNVTISKFLGIPYAEPPTGDLRFRKPVSKMPLKEPLKVQDFGPACMQNYLSIFPAYDTDSEDCLYLNIFRPEANTDIGQKMPVMIWIYGGAFVVGSSTAYIGDALAANGPVIVVTINYRLSAWGFLSTGDQTSPGNYGLWDQHLAIQWVHDNIDAFGGDSSKVTIFGESAGSASVIFQGLFPGNKGLFQRIIAQSGTAAAHWAIKPNPKSDAEKLATLVGCETNDIEIMIDCLRKMPAEKLNTTINNNANWPYSLPFPFIPTVDNAFVPVSPAEVLAEDNTVRTDIKEHFASFDLLIGITSGEGVGSAQRLTGAYQEPENFLPNKTYFDDHLVPLLVKSIYGDEASTILNQAVVAEYTDWDDPENPELIRENFYMMHGDYLMLADLYRTTKLHASLSNSLTYQYYFNLLPYKSVFTRPTWFRGSRHCDDLLYMFGNQMDFAIPGLNGKRDFQDWEKKAADDIMTLWTNFAKTGNPNKPRDLGIDWLPYTQKYRRYLEILNKVTESRMRERLRERKAKFWDELLPALAKASECHVGGSAAGTCSRDRSCPP